jgi:phosphatidylglycerol---prolipoprotein diacylglyceryl transferase
MLESLHRFAHSFMLYPIIMGIAWGMSFNYIKDKIERSELKSFYFVFSLIFIASWIGAKILFLITIPTNEIIFNRLDFWSGGGFVFYGGLLLAMGLVLFTSYLNPHIKRHLSHYSAVYFKALLLGHAIGRVGCFVVGCCYGMSWHGIQMPVQLFESMGLMGLFWYFPKSSTLENNIFFYLTGYAGLRFVLEFIRSDIERGVILGLPSSQLISLCLIVILGLWRMKKLRF